MADPVPCRAEVSRGRGCCPLRGPLSSPLPVAVGRGRLCKIQRGNVVLYKGEIKQDCVKAQRVRLRGFSVSRGCRGGGTGVLHPLPALAHHSLCPRGAWFGASLPCPLVAAGTEVPSLGGGIPVNGESCRASRVVMCGRPLSHPRVLQCPGKGHGGDTAGR